MSMYQFFASDKQLEVYDNNRIVLDSKKQLLKGKKRKISVFDEREALRIIIEDDIKHMKLYTEKKYGAFIEWNYTDENAKVIIQYIERHLKVSREIELWNVWLGPKENAKINKCSIENLTITDIKDIWGKEFFEFAECLKIYR
ncbi:MAG: hypothetical protein EOM00_15075 [Clostridia bacterium]|nr:hypothetical protein [Clostridia bacterium]